MKGKMKRSLFDGLYTLLIIGLLFGLSVLLQDRLGTPALIPMLFVLGVFLVSLRTDGYFWGITCALISAFAVNYAFTFPYYAFNFQLIQSLVSFVVMLLVAIMTSTLTTQVKAQEKMRAESEKEKMRANLLRAISHDLRTPLTSIYGSTSAIVENYDTLTKERQLQLLEEIGQDAEWLIRMVENLLSVTRIDGQRVQVIKTPTVLEELIDASLLKFHKRYPRQEVKVRIPDEFISIPMDAILMEQVITNLLENAVVHAEGMTELCLSVHAEGQKAVFRVMDDGCGIPSDRLEHIFSGYNSRPEPHTDSSRHNMGIGLSVCATIIRAHGGVITASNREEGGALFQFTLEMEAEHEQS